MDIAAASVEKEWQPLEDATQGDMRPCVEVISQPPVVANVARSMSECLLLLLFTSHFQLGRA